MFIAFSGNFSSIITSSAVIPTLAARGLPPYVEPVSYTHLISIILACGGMKSKDTISSNSNSKPEQTKMESYEDLWKKVANKEKDGLPKSALELVDSIFILAKSDSNSVHQIKALLHKAKYTGELDEDGVKSSIKLIAQEGLSLPDPMALSISHSLLGELYYNYYMMNVWEINQRTPIPVSYTHLF